jgi:hypothetical protein
MSAEYALRSHSSSFRAEWLGERSEPLRTPETFNDPLLRRPRQISGRGLALFSDALVPETAAAAAAVRSARSMSKVAVFFGQGWLLKRSDWLHSWNPRYFRLRGRFLQYFVTDNEAFTGEKPKGAFDLSGASVVAAWQSNSTDITITLRAGGGTARAPSEPPESAYRESSGRSSSSPRRPRSWGSRFGRGALSRGSRKDWDNSGSLSVAERIRGAVSTRNIHLRAGDKDIQKKWVECLRKHIFMATPGMAGAGGLGTL